jgi:hypothetical protein
MSLQAKVFGKIRGIFLDLLPSNREDEQLHLSGQAEQLIAFGAAPYQEIVRQGRAFMANTTTAVATVTAVPSTAYGFAIWNGESDGGRSYIIDAVAALFTVNGGAALVHDGIIGCLGLVREAAPASPTGATPKQMNGMGNADTKVKVILAADNPYGGGAGTVLATTGIAGNWFPIGNSVNSAVNALPGYQIWQNVDGRIIVPPGRLFLLHTLGSVNTSSAQLYIWWHEKVILNG